MLKDGRKEGSLEGPESSSKVLKNNKSPESAMQILKHHLNWIREGQAGLDD